MVRRALVLFLLLLATGPASARFEIAESEFRPGEVSAITADASRFYVFLGAYLTRVERDGTILDRDGIWVKEAYNRSISAASGDGIIVLATGHESYGVLVGIAPDGRVLWEYPAPKNRGLLCVVFDGTAFTALWSGYNSDGLHDYGLIRVDASGKLLRMTTLLEETQAVVITMVPVDGGVMVAWRQAAQIHAAYVRDEEALLRTVVAQSSWSGHLSMATNGVEAFLMWSAPETGRIDGTLVPTSLQSAAEPFTIAASSGREHAAAWDGVQFRLAWETPDHRAIETADLHETLGLVRGPVLFRDVEEKFLRLAAGAGGVMYVRGRVGVFADAGSPVPADREPHVLREERPYTGRPHITWSGSSYAVVWETEPFSMMSARFFTPEGTPVGDSFPVKAGPPCAYVAQIAAAADTLLVLFQQCDDGIVAQRFDLRGNAVDAEPFAIPGVAVTAASDGRDFLIAASTGCTMRTHTLGARSAFIPGGAIELQLCEMDPPVVPALRGIRALHLAWDGTEYGLLYHLMYDGQCYCTPVSDFIPWLLRVSASGVPTRAIPLVNPDLRRIGQQYLAFGMTAGPGAYYVGWYSGGVLVPFDLSAPLPLPDTHVVAPHLVVWTGASYLVLHNYGYEFRHASGQKVSDTTGFQTWVAASDGSGRAMLVFSEYPRQGFLLGAIVQAPAPKRRAVRK